MHHQHSVAARHTWTQMYTFTLRLTGAPFHTSLLKLPLSPPPKHSPLTSVGRGRVGRGGGGGQPRGGLTGVTNMEGWRGVDGQPTAGPPPPHPAPGQEPSLRRKKKKQKQKQAWGRVHVR